MAIPDEPITRAEQYLAKMAGQDVDLPAEPVTRMEQYLDYIAKNGGGGGGSDNIFVATYGETTYEEALAAWNAGKVLVFKRIFAGAGEGESFIAFQTSMFYFQGGGTGPRFSAYYYGYDTATMTDYSLSSSGWSSRSYSLLKETDMVLTNANSRNSYTVVKRYTDTDENKNQLYIDGRTIPNPPSEANLYLMSGNHGVMSWGTGPTIPKVKTIIDAASDYPAVSTAFNAAFASWLTNAVTSPGTITRAVASVDTSSIISAIATEYALGTSSVILEISPVAGSMAFVSVASAATSGAATNVSGRASLFYPIDNVGLFDLFVDVIISPLGEIIISGYALAHPTT